jgi:hypothetical protein
LIEIADSGKVKGDRSETRNENGEKSCPRTYEILECNPHNEKKEERKTPLNASSRTFFISKQFEPEREHQRIERWMLDFKQLFRAIEQRTGVDDHREMSFHDPMLCVVSRYQTPVGGIEIMVVDERFVDGWQGNPAENDDSKEKEDEKGSTALFIDVHSF